MGILSILHVCAVSTEEGVMVPETVITGSCEPLHQCWELNPRPLQEQQVLLIAEPSLQPHFKMS